MKKPARVAVSAAVAIAGLAATVVCVILLARQGLDRAEKILSIASCLFTIAGFALSWLTWRRTAPALPETPATASSGPASVAVAGSSSGSIDAEASDVDPSQGTPAAPASGVHATGAGSVAVGGDNSGRIRTRATGRRGKKP